MELDDSTARKHQALASEAGHEELA